MSKTGGRTPETGDSTLKPGRRTLETGECMSKPGGNALKRESATQLQESITLPQRTAPERMYVMHEINEHMQNKVAIAITMTPNNNQINGLEKGKGCIK